MDGLPEKVRDSAGRTEPFTPERITRQLFLAGESLGLADPFLARELTDGVLHFLALECGGQPTTSEQIAETVVKIVRELGHPALARAYQERAQQPPPKSRLKPVKHEWPVWFTPTHSPNEIRRQAAREALTTLSESIVPRELVSAHHEGLLTLHDWATPFELTSYVLPDDTAEAWSQACLIAGHSFHLDSPEYALAEQGGDVSAFVRQLELAAERDEIQVQLHLHTVEPPPTVETASSPLFGPTPSANGSQLDAIRVELLRQVRHERLTIAWHVASTNVDDPLHELAVQQALAGQAMEFVVDRPKRPTILGPGCTRKTAASLTVVGMNLARLAEQMGHVLDQETFHKKVGSLARFAKTVGHVRQDFLRHHGRPILREGFLLERAPLLVQPLGLEVVAHRFDRPTEAARSLLRTIRQALESDRPRMLPLGVELTLDTARLGEAEGYLAPKQQMRLASSLATEIHGSCWLITNAIGRPWTASEALDALRTAVTSDVSRFRLGLRH